MSRARRRVRWVGALGWLALIVASQLLVSWRQNRGLELADALGRLQEEQEIAEAERVDATRRIQVLRSRQRVVRRASGMGMHLAVGDEIVILPRAGAEVQP